MQLKMLTFLRIKERNQKRKGRRGIIEDGSQGNPGNLENSINLGPGAGEGKRKGRIEERRKFSEVVK